MGTGVLVICVGDSLIETAISGLESVFRRGYTADLMIAGPSDRPVTVFATDSLGGEEGSVPPLTRAEDLAGWVQNLPGVVAVGGQLGAAANLGRDEQVGPQVPLMGINPDTEARLFPDRVEFLEGGWPSAGDREWILLSESSRKGLALATGGAVNVGDRVTVSAVSEAAGTVIRELVVRGVIRFRHQHPSLELVSLAPADALRDLLGFASLSDGPPRLTDQERAFVENFDPDALFEAPTTVPESSQPEAVAPVPPQALWQFLLIRARAGTDLPHLEETIRHHLADEGIPGRVQGWVEGAGPVAVMALSVGWVFDGLVALVTVVVLLITMNALALSISERTAEIGTMRALGAQKGFLLGLIGAETGLLTLAAAVLGLALGEGILLVLGVVGVPAPNVFFEALFGGPVLVPALSPGPALKAVGLVAFWAATATWYPARLALGIAPRLAMGTREAG